MKYLVILLFTATAAMASGPSGPTDPRFENGNDPFLASQSFKGHIQKIDVPNLLQVKLEKSGKELILKVPDDIKLLARKKKHFGKKNLEFSDFAVGQEIRVFFKPGKGTITSIKVLKPARADLS